MCGDYVRKPFALRKSPSRFEQEADWLLAQYVWGRRLVGMTPNLLRYFAYAFIGFAFVIPLTRVPKDISFMAVPAVGMLCLQLSLLMARTERRAERIKQMEVQLERLMLQPDGAAR
jgi:hypothetical protein